MAQLGFQHSVCVDEEGVLWTFGANVCGELGYPKSETESLPKKIENLRAASVSCGTEVTVCADIFGDVWHFGRNILPQENPTARPQKISFGKNEVRVRSVSCGKGHVICLTDEGNIWSFGLNNHGQLGLGLFSDSSSPRQVNVRDIVKADCGFFHSVIMDSSGHFYVCGSNNFGQLGMDTDGQRLNTFQQLPNTPDIVSYTCGNSFTMFVDSVGDVYATGRNNYGQLGLGDNTNRNQLVKVDTLRDIVLLSCGSHHTMCVNIEGDFYVFGRNDSGQLGLGDLHDRDMPTMHPSLSNLISLSNGGRWSIVKDNEDRIFVFGWASKSRLGFRSFKRFITKPHQLPQEYSSLICTRVIGPKSARK